MTVKKLAVTPPSPEEAEAILAGAQKKSPERRRHGADYLELDDRIALPAVSTEFLEDTWSRLHDLLYMRGYEFIDGHWEMRYDLWPTKPVVRLRGKKQEEMRSGPELTEENLRLMAFFLKLTAERNFRR